MSVTVFSNREIFPECWRSGPGCGAMIVLIVAPGISIESSQISQLIQKVSWQSDSPPRLVSSIQFHPVDQSKFITDLSIPDQCRLAIQETVNLGDTQSEKDTEDYQLKDICRTIVITNKFDDGDLVALAAWNKVSSKEFTAKSLVVLGTEERLDHDILLHCLAQSYHFNNVYMIVESLQLNSFLDL